MMEAAANNTEHITVCICTYKRPLLLRRLLRELEVQETGGLFTYSIVVADNDEAESARIVVADFSAVSRVQTIYCVEPQQNIALARNKALQFAKGEFVAFVDDDEYPLRDWLLTLRKACELYKVDGALGPVRPHFEQEPPLWVLKGRFFERPSYSSGFLIDWSKGRTGNLLFNRRVLVGMEQAFRSEFITGEDQDFFRRAIAKGCLFAWCNEAVAYETVPPSRWGWSFMLRKALLRGKISVRWPGSGFRDTLKAIVAIPSYAFVLPFAAIVGRYLYMSYLIKMFGHMGRILTLLGFELVADKYITE